MELSNYILEGAAKQRIRMFSNCRALLSGGLELRKLTQGRETVFARGSGFFKAPTVDWL